MEVVHPTGDHTHTVIFLHGRDSTAAEFKPEFFESESSEGRTLPEVFPGIRWVFPTADSIFSERYGCRISQWFDMWSTENPHKYEDRQDMIASFTRISQIVKREALEVGHQNVFLGGISQGAALAIHALFAQQYCLAGFFALSSWMPKPDKALNYFIGSKQACEQLETPAIMLHNQDDDTIALKYGKELRNTLKNVGMRVEWHDYECGGHWLNEPEGVDALVRWFTRRMGRRSVDGGQRSAQEAAKQLRLDSATRQREVAVLAKRIRDNMSDERKQELYDASIMNRQGDPYARRPSTDAVDKFCLSRAQRQLDRSRDFGGKMKLINAS